MSVHNRNARYVTPEQSDHWWLGRLSLAVAVSLKRPDPRAAHALEDFLRSGKPSRELSRMLREELKEAK